METLHHPKSRVRSKRSSRGRIHNAIENGNVFVVRTLLAMGMDTEELDSNGRTPLVHAIMKLQEAICKLLLDKGASSRDTNGWTPLASAAFKFNEDLCQFLVKKGCTLCLNTEQKVQLKPELSCRIHLAAAGGYETALQLLLDMGADINERNSFGETALLEAVYNNQLSSVKILIGRGADATISTHEGFSALNMAVRGLTDSEMMRFLLMM
ncbi:ankyrin [Terfezia boudieri ATCC MYA-4762]|uniref:Ankyrin n=1 Tax=Terfezia boudieri ATCC MYA-4762 TaxID=1051890 RepID=A0A3N4LQB2_9PEZI|nr:ankyrin [Terfezia boudieri ATCC MYA-4762]